MRPSLRMRTSVQPPAVDYSMVTTRTKKVCARSGPAHQCCSCAALVLREQNSVVNNGMKYTQAYLYNQQKAINYVPPRDPKDDREVSLGTVHEKVVSFIARLPSSRHASSMTSTHKLGWPTCWHACRITRQTKSRIFCRGTGNATRTLGIIQKQVGVDYLIWGRTNSFRHARNLSGRSRSEHSGGCSGAAARSEGSTGSAFDWPTGKR